MLHSWLSVVNAGLAMQAHSGGIDCVSSSYSACHPSGIGPRLLLAVQLMHGMLSPAQAPDPGHSVLERQVLAAAGGMLAGQRATPAPGVSCRTGKSSAAELASHQQQNWQVISCRIGKPSAAGMAGRQQQCVQEPVQHMAHAAMPAALLVQGRSASAADEELALWTSRQP